MVYPYAHILKKLYMIYNYILPTRICIYIILCIDRPIPSFFGQARTSAASCERPLRWTATAAMAWTKAMRRSVWRPTG